MRALTMSVSSKPTVGQPLIQILYFSFVVSWLHQILTHNTETKKKQTNKEKKKTKQKENTLSTVALSQITKRPGSLDRFKQVRRILLKKDYRIACDINNKKEYEGLQEGQ